MAEQSTLERMGVRFASVGSSVDLVIAAPKANGGPTVVGNLDADASTASNRSGFYFDQTANAEKIGMIVGGQTGPTYTRSGTSVNVSINGSITSSDLVATQILYASGAGLITGDASFTRPATSQMILGDTADVGGSSITLNGNSTVDKVIEILDEAGSGINMWADSGGFAGVGIGTFHSNDVFYVNVSTRALIFPLDMTSIAIRPLTAFTQTVTIQNGTTNGLKFTPQGGAGTSWLGNITTAALTASRTYTLPDASGTVTLQAAALGTNQNIPFTNGSGQLQTGAGFISVGTPSVTAPSTATNGIGLQNGPVAQYDAVGASYAAAAFGNGSSSASSFFGLACQGTAAVPGATASGDSASLRLVGHDGTAFTTRAASIFLNAASLWTNTNHETNITFSTTPNGSTTVTVAGRIDSNQALVWGGNFNSVGTFSAGVLRPHIQTASTADSQAGIAQSKWINNATGPTCILAKSRSGTVGTQGVITTGDTLGSLSWQGDDGTNFIAAADIFVSAIGTIGTGQVPGLMTFRTATSAGVMTGAFKIDSAQISCFASGGAVVGQGLWSGATLTPRVQVFGNNNNVSAVSVAHFQNSTAAGSFFLGKARSNTLGTMTVVTTGDTLGTINWQGADGTNFVSAGTITVSATGTVGAGQIPGLMTFQTANSAGTLTTALTINSVQTLTTSGILSLGSGLKLATTTFSNANTVLASTTVIQAQTGTMSAARTATLPAANSVAAGTIFYVSDFSGTVTATNTLSILPAGADTINLGASYVVTQANGTIAVISDGSSKWTVFGGYELPTLSASKWLFNNGTIASWQSITSSDVSGLGSMATQSANAVAITGGTLAGITSLAAAVTSTATSGTVNLLSSIITANPGGASTGIYQNVVSSNTSAANAQNLTSATAGLVGLSVTITHAGTGVVTGADGIQIQGITSGASGTFTTLRGAHVINATKGGGTTITTQVGLEVDSMTSGTTNFAIRTGSGQVSLGDATASSSTTTGGLISAGGVGIAGAAYIGGAGTVTTSLPALNVTQTWNAGAVAFTGIFGNFTSTSSAAASLVMDLQVGSSSVFKVQKDGTVTAAAATDIAAQFGYLKMGFAPSGTSTSIYIGQTSVFTTANYALLQNSVGDTAINAANNKSVTIRQGGSTRFTVANLVTTSATTFTIAAATVASGTSTAFLITGALNTNMTTTVEVPDVDFALNRTVQWANGAIATQRAFVIRAPTYSFVSGTQTITTAATLAITGAPIVGANAAITNSYAFWVQAGFTRLDGRLFINAPNTAPTDADIPTAAVTWYLDEVGNTLKARVRYADGTTLKTGTVALV